MVYYNERKIRGKVVGRSNQWILFEIEETHEMLMAHRGELKLIHPKVSSGVIS